MQTLIERMRAFLGLRQLRYGANASAMTVLLLALLVMGNVLAVRFHRRIDVTATQSFSISQQSQQIVAALNQPLEVVGYFGAQDKALQSDVESRLKEYVAATPRFSYRFVDPDTDPVAAKNDNITSYGTIVVKYADRKIQASGSDEKAITGAILKASQDVQTTVYVLTGHRERSLDNVDPNGLSQLQVVLTDDNFKVAPINLTISTTIPLSNSLLLVADPQDPFTQPEFQSILDYINNGGRMVLMSNPLSVTPLEVLLQVWGLEWQPDIIIDEQSQVGNPLAPAVLQYPYTDITRNMTGQASVFNSVRSIKEIGNPPPQVTRQIFLSSSAKSSAATKFTDGNVEVQEGDAQGPLSFGYILESPTKMRAVLIGDVDFVSNGYLQAAQANAALFRNAVAWATAQDSLIAVPTIAPIDRKVFLTNDQSTLIFYSCVIGLPLLFVVTGIAVWWRRR
jgi:ABC-type uncharacterized transport system involved in gliding motility auxiliary subunit